MIYGNQTFERERPITYTYQEERKYLPTIVVLTALVTIQGLSS